MELHSHRIEHFVSDVAADTYFNDSSFFGHNAADHGSKVFADCNCNISSLHCDCFSHYDDNNPSFGFGSSFHCFMHFLYNKSSTIDCYEHYKNWHIIANANDAADVIKEMEHYYNKNFKD